MSTLNTLAACQSFVESQPPTVIASQLRKDQRICQENSGFPSLLVYCLPPTSSNASKQIAQAISFEDEDPDHSLTYVPLVISKIRLAGIVQNIKAYLVDMKRQETYANTPEGDGGPIPPQLIPSDEDFNASLKVLRYLQLPFPVNLDDSTPLSDLVATIEAQIQLGKDVCYSQLQPQPYLLHPRSTQKQKVPNRNRKCYICLFLLTTPHPLYPALCVPCGDFNTTSSELSLPPQFNFTSKTAIVTGARVNLGYHTALRLLRAGCNVIATTRYPYDAETRYLAEADSETWKGRLRIVGGDFRTAKDVFALISVVKGCLRHWHQDKLDLLINNAAQTLTDHVDVEVRNGEREEDLRSRGTCGLIIDSGYTSRLRGDVTTTEIPDRDVIDSQHGGLGDKVDVVPEQECRLVDKSIKSSWIQKLSDIPYEDVISAHSINTFVPLILIRELLPIISSPRSSLSSQQLSKPSGYIVNVSSREGIPESRPSHPAKAGHHVHTNMSKAALNMLTETEAGVAWQTGRVAINSVDPGYMSADPQWMEMVNMGDEKCPIGWEDGAARVLWPVAMGEKGTPVWGRFLKHFQAIDVQR